MTSYVCGICMYSRPLSITALIAVFCCACRAQPSIQPIFESAHGSPIRMTCGPGNIVAGDINNDDKPDLVVACGGDRSITVFIGQGTGRFLATPGSPIKLASPPNEIIIKDINGDNHPDLVIASHDSYRIMILRGNGTGNFPTPPDSSLIMRNGNHAHTHGLGVGDLNGDGSPDIVTANNSDSDISVALNKGDGNFTLAPGSPYAVSPSPYPLTVGHVNGDAHLDIISTSTQSASKVLTLLYGDGQGNFRRNDIPLRTATPWFVANGDINNDNINDLAVTHSERNELTVLVGTESGKFAEVNGSPFDLGSSAWHVAIADVNSDAKPDILAAANNGVKLMLGDGKGQFALAPGSPFLTGKGTWHLAVSDVNRDGKPDVVTSNLESNNVSVLLAR
jgi:hypothetical protein